MKINHSLIKTIIFLFIPLFIFISCVNNSITLQIKDRQNLKNIPSASGIVKTKFGIYVIGDNTPFVFNISDYYEIIRRIKIFEGEWDSIIPSELKPDYEAIAGFQNNNVTELFVFGSGSKSPQRDILVRIRFADSIQIFNYSLQNFYLELKKNANLKDNELNIEAAAIDSQSLFLFNRGKNLIFKYDFLDFLNYLRYSQNCPVPEVFNIDLPAPKGINAGFSGATYSTEKQKIIFTASLENTDNFLLDGEILGSYVGIIDLKKLKNNYRPKCILIAENDETLPLKVESVEINNYISDDVVEILLVTDSDGGYSEIIKAYLRW